LRKHKDGARFPFFMNNFFASKITWSKKARDVRRQIFGNRKLGSGALPSPIRTSPPSDGRHYLAHILLAQALSACYFGANYSYRVYKGRPVANAEKISIALPTEMVAIVRRAVESGEYASSSEVVRDALRDWTYKRSLREQGIAELRDLWLEALRDPTPGVAADEVLD
jgi:antitoxin ParD1/3/4